jgi:hypothetical protein
MYFFFLLLPSSVHSLRLSRLPQLLLFVSLAHNVTLDRTSLVGGIRLVDLDQPDDVGFRLPALLQWTLVESSSSAFSPPVGRA